MTNREQQTTTVFQSTPTEGFVSYLNRSTDTVIPAYNTREITREVVGPLFVQDPTAEKPHSVLVLHTETDMGDQTILYAAQADLRWYARGSGRTEAQVDVHHSFAKDDEGSRSSLLNLSLASFQVTSVDGTRLGFEAWITKAYYYADGDTGESDPGEGDSILTLTAEDKGEEDPKKGGDWYANAKYPYLPPRKDNVSGYKLPLRVSGILYGPGDYDTDKIFRKAAGLGV